MVGWHHQLNGREFKQAPGDDEEQGSLVCCSPWGRKELDMTERLNNTPYESAILLLGICPKEQNSYMHTRLSHKCLQKILVFFFYNRQKLTRTKMFTNRSIVCQYNGIFHRKIKTSTHTITWMNLKLNQFSESSQPIKSTYCIIHLCKIPEKVN